MQFISFLLGGYFVGSLPTAYLYVRLRSGLDIRTSGSGNVGAFNAFDVTQSKTAGLVVGIIDALKGLLVVLLADMVFAGSFSLVCTALAGTLLGHNYSIWLKFKGGRGLATAAGGMFGIGYSCTIVWCVAWFAAYKVFHDILHANLSAILATPVIILLLPTGWIEATNILAGHATEYVLFTFIMSGIHLLSHIDVVRGVLKIAHT